MRNGRFYANAILRRAPAEGWQRLRQGAFRMRPVKQRE